METIPYAKTYCNPLPIPDYPRGIFSTPEEKVKRDPHWGWGHLDWDYRELADPTVIWYDNKWNLYASGSMLWWTDDFVHWTHEEINTPFVGYAPTVVEHAGRFLLCASCSALYEADRPCGPFREISPQMLLPGGKPLENFQDPMLFADDDGRLYAYWGIGRGIFGAELDPKRPWQLITEPETFISFDPSHEWERGGYWNQHNCSCPEGSWMFKHRDNYYLTFSAPGTYPKYAMGVYRSKSPLGPFTYAQRNPMIKGPGSVVQGAGHGSIVKGPDETLWAFYTCHVKIHHSFERRIGMDPVGIDENGDLYAPDATETPQWAPGVKVHPEKDNDTGLIPLSYRELCGASSCVPGHEPPYATDLNVLTWWQAAEDDATPWFTVDLFRPQTVHALRLHWKEPGLDYERGVVPGPMKYVLECCVESDPFESNAWEVVLDRQESECDLLVDYRAFAPRQARYWRLRVTEKTADLGVGLIDLTLFGENSFDGNLRDSKIERICNA